jgi:hypothetical protein
VIACIEDAARSLEGVPLGRIYAILGALAKIDASPNSKSSSDSVSAAGRRRMNSNQVVDSY